MTRIGSAGITPAAASATYAPLASPALTGTPTVEGVSLIPATILAGINARITAGGTLAAPTLTIDAHPRVTETLANGELSMDADAATGNSADAGQTPASGDLLFAFFRATKSWSNLAYITAMLNSVAPSGLTGAYAALYSYNGSGTLTLMDVTADIKASWTGTYQVHKLALAGGTADITEGGLYAIGLLQVGTTPGSLYGANGYPSWSFGQAAESWKCAILAAQTTCPATIATTSLTSGNGPWRMIASVTTS